MNLGLWRDVDLLADEDNTWLLPQLSSKKQELVIKSKKAVLVMRTGCCIEIFKNRAIGLKYQLFPHLKLY